MRYTYAVVTDIRTLRGVLMRRGETTRAAAQEIVLGLTFPFSTGCGGRGRETRVVTDMRM